MKSLAAAVPVLQTPGAAELVEARAKVVITVDASDRAARDEAIAPLVQIAGKR
jgi:hypothetical protein